MPIIAIFEVAFHQTIPWVLRYRLSICMNCTYRVHAWFWRPESGICYVFSLKHACVHAHFCRITEKRRSRTPIVNSQKDAFTIVNAFKWGQSHWPTRWVYVACTVKVTQGHTRRIAWMSQRSKHEQLHRGTAITMSVYDERFRSLILPSKSSMNAPLDYTWGSSCLEYNLYKLYSDR